MKYHWNDHSKDDPDAGVSAGQSHPVEILEFIGEKGIVKDLFVYDCDFKGYGRLSKEKKNTQNEKRKLSRQERKQIDTLIRQAPTYRKHRPAFRAGA